MRASSHSLSSLTRRRQQVSPGAAEEQGLLVSGPSTQGAAEGSLPAWPGQGPWKAAGEGEGEAFGEGCSPDFSPGRHLGCGQQPPAPSAPAPPPGSWAVSPLDWQGPGRACRPRPLPWRACPGLGSGQATPASPRRAVVWCSAAWGLLVFLGAAPSVVTAPRLGDPRTGGRAHRRSGVCWGRRGCVGPAQLVPCPDLTSGRLLPDLPSSQLGWRPGAEPARSGRTRVALRRMHSCPLLRPPGGQRPLCAQGRGWGFSVSLLPAGFPGKGPAWGGTAAQPQL